MERVIRLPPEVRTETRYEPTPADALRCMPEPVAPAALSQQGAQDREAAAYEAEAREAGRDCRSKVDWLRAWADNLQKQ